MFFHEVQVTLKSMCLVVVLLLTQLTAGCNVQAVLERPYANPPSTFQDVDLVGTWETRYFNAGIDTLIIRPDKTFKQIYRDQTISGYVYETPWNEWWTERLNDGRIRLHLRGARYYLGGVQFAEQNGLSPIPKDQPNYWGANEPPPFPFYDPIAKDFVNMVGELVLNVRSDTAHNLILMHMWESSDWGFPIFGGEEEEYRQVNTQ